jgi:hypothetical protein
MLLHNAANAGPVRNFSGVTGGVIFSDKDHVITIMSAQVDAVYINFKTVINKYS